MSYNNYYLKYVPVQLVQLVQLPHRFLLADTRLVTLPMRAAAKGSFLNDPFQ